MTVNIDHTVVLSSLALLSSCHIIHLMFFGGGGGGGGGGGWVVVGELRVSGVSGLNIMEEWKGKWQLFIASKKPSRLMLR